MDHGVLFSEALKIEDPWSIEDIKFDPLHCRLNIHINFKKGAVFEYYDESTKQSTFHKAYDTEEKVWRHLNFFEYECYLIVRTPRIKPGGGGIKLVLPSWSGNVYGFTLMYEAYLLQLCKHMPISQVARMSKTYDKKLWKLLDCYIQKGLYEADHIHVTCLGIDETSRKRGHEYITLFVDLENRKTIHIAPGKGHETITDFVESFLDSKGKVDHITDVSCDMSPAFIKGVKQEFPKAQITFDRFHIMKLVNEAVDAVRRSEVSTEPALKKSRFALLKNKANLTQSQQKKRDYISQLNLKTSRALRMRDAFQEIYKTETIDDFIHALNEWYSWIVRSQLEPFKKLGRTIKKHMHGIVRWKVSQINNGILEALNSVVQAAKRKARGYGEKHFKIMAYFLTGKLNFKKFNEYLPTYFS
jgi:transposase